jgi:hypothetical protein
MPDTVSRVPVVAFEVGPSSAVGLVAGRRLDCGADAPCQSMSAFRSERDWARPGISSLSAFFARSAARPEAPFGGSGLGRDGCVRRGIV